jgi:hypothetical protein
MPTKGKGKGKGKEKVHKVSNSFSFDFLTSLTRLVVGKAMEERAGPR